MRFDFTEDQHEIKRTAKDLLASRSTAEKVREAAESGEYDLALWKELAELGWPGVAVDEAHGGGGLGYVELAGLLGDRLEFAFVLFASAVGLYSLLTGYRRHRLWQALALMAPGLAILWIGVLVPAIHHSQWPHAVVMTIGGTLVGLAHLANLRMNAGHVHGPSCAH